MIKKAVIPAAGLGTRFLPITKNSPKEMLPLVDKPAIQYVVEEAVASGVDDIIIITGRGKRAIEDHFDKAFELEWILKTKNNSEALEEIERISHLADIHYIRQKEPLGLGHAILCAKKHIGDDA
ncbi:MAG: NTP transferase domain-containing protein, partial [Proteobacteria bacterium]|nr:NTP transferase domain-containing protein [Pseudomonadota bacterium]